MQRRPLGARRDHAARYLVLTIAAFAVTVAGVRWYLDTAGYPTIGGGGLHVAHVLWGGLALFIAVLLPLLWTGPRVLHITAILAGVGVGLFIDEVGKFLTSTNDYFFAPAAPIIYGVVLLLVLLWLLVRRRGDTPLDATHALIDALGAGIDGHLTRQDRDQAIARLRLVQGSAGEAAGSDVVADGLVATLRSPAMDERLAREGWMARGDARRTLERFLPTRLERWLIVIGLVLAIATAALSALVLVASTSESLDWAELLAADTGRLEIPTEPIWVLSLLAINVVVGVGSAVAIVLIALGRRLLGMTVGFVAVLIDMVAGGLVGFYAVQIGALTSTLESLVLLGLIADQRTRLQRAAAEAAEKAEQTGQPEETGHIDAAAV